MRAIFSVVGLLLVVAIVALLARDQLKSLAAPQASPRSPEAAAVVVPAGTPRQQVQQFQQAVQESMQPARPEPDTK